MNDTTMPSDSELNPVFLIKFISGEEILTQLVKETETEVEIKSPMLLITDVDSIQGTHTIVLFPWVPQSLFQEIPTVTLQKTNNILYKLLLENKEMIDYYYGVVFDSYDSIIKVKDSNTKKLSEMNEESRKNIVSFNRNNKTPKSPVTN